VLVIDDGGGLHRSLLVERGRMVVRLIGQDRAGPAAARNRGAHLARGRYLAFIDDDCAPAHDWLAEMGAVLKKTPGGGCGGRTLNAWPDNKWAETSQAMTDFLYSRFNRPFGPAGFLTTNNLAVNRRAFLELGGFDAAFPFAGGEDRDFCLRWRRAGRPLIYHPRAIVQHFHRLTGRTFLRQHYTYGRGARLVHHRLSRNPGREPRLEKISFYLDLILYGLRKNRSRRGVAISGLTLLAQLAHASGHLVQSADLGDGLKPPATGFVKP
jgi:GT2 family glycosyltransferase